MTESCRMHTLGLGVYWLTPEFRPEQVRSGHIWYQVTHALTKGRTHIIARQLAAIIHGAEAINCGRVRRALPTSRTSLVSADGPVPQPQAVQRVTNLGHVFCFLAQNLCRGNCVSLNWLFGRHTYQSNANMHLHCCLN